MLAPLAQPTYRRLLLSSALWWQTLAMWTVVAGVVVLDMTDSALAVALLSFWRRAAQLSVGSVAGILGDRLGRRNTLILSQCVIFGSCGVLFLLFAGGRLSAWQMTTAAFVIGVAWTIDAPARAALVPDLLAGKSTADAMLLESFIQSIIGSAGAYVAGWLLVWLGTAGGLGALLILTGLNVALLIWLGRSQVAQTVPVAVVPIWRSITEGVGYVRSQPALLVVTLVSAVLNTLIFPAMSLMPVFARDVFARGPVGLGMLTTSYSLGTFAGLYLAHHIRRHLSFQWIFSAGALLQCIALVTFAFSPVFNLSLLLLFVAGIGQAGFHTMRNVILLTTASNEMRGRAMSTVVLTQGIGLPGELLTGTLGETIGPRLAVGLQASTAAIGSILAMGWIRQREMTDRPS